MKLSGTSYFSSNVTRKVTTADKHQTQENRKTGELITETPALDYLMSSLNTVKFGENYKMMSYYPIKYHNFHAVIKEQK